MKFVLNPSCPVKASGGRYSILPILRVITLLLICWTAVPLTFAQPPFQKLPPEGKSAGNPQGSQKPRTEEEEEPEKKDIPRKDMLPKKSPPPKSDANSSFNKGEIPARSELPAALAEESRKTNQPREIQNFYFRLAVPYDILTTGANVDYSIVPLPARELSGETILFTKLVGGQPEKEYKLPTANVAGVKPFEEIVCDQVDSFLARKTELKRIVVIETALKELKAAEAWHRLALSSNLRTGDGWRPMQEKLLAKILQMRRELLTAFQQAKLWENSDKLAQELITAFPNEPAVMFDVNKYRLLRGRDTLKKENEQDYRDLREKFQIFLALPEAENDPITQSVRVLLREHAKEMARKANAQLGKGDAAGALQTLRDAETYDPDSKEIKDARLTMKAQILYVGVPSLPIHMSPTTALSDSEKWAMELIFESLLQTIPDDTLGRIFRPQLAVDLPTGSGDSRTFRLAKTTRWPANNNKDAVTAADVSGSLRLYRNFQFAPGMEDISLLGEDEIEDSTRIKLKLQQRLLEPLPRFNFKVLPARTVPDLDSDRFSRNPMGSGPYMFKGLQVESPVRTCAVFVANPAYAHRPERFGLPVIREIRLYVPRPENVASDFESGQLHILADPGAEIFARTTNESKLANMVRGYTMENNRRIWMLAINHRRPPLWKDDLRRAINHSIDRDQILTETQRPTGTKYHQVLNGPFPTNSWPTPSQSKPLFQPELAKGLFAESLKEPQAFPIPLSLTIRYCSADPGAAQAASQIKEHIERQSDKKLQLKIEGLGREEFQERVINRHEFDLAYTSFDYKDDQFWLGGLLDGNAAGNDQRNFLGYLGQDSGAKPEDKRIAGTLGQIRGTTDFAKLKEQMNDLFGMVNYRVPFVPLWQLDRQIVVHSGLEIRFDSATPRKIPSSLDPATLFNGIEYWRLK